MLRYFNAYGPRQRPDMAFPRIVAALAEGRPFGLYGDGLQSRSFTYVGDVVAATALAIERAEPGTTYNVGGGEEATMNETIAALEAIAGRSLEVLREARCPATSAGRRPTRPASGTDLGWQPTTSLADGLRAQWDWAAARVGAS